MFVFGSNQQTGDTYTLDVPKREIDHAAIYPDASTRVAIFSAPQDSPPVSTDPQSPNSREQTDSQPVDDGDIVDVEIDCLGDQGDGIGRVGLDTS